MRRLSITPFADLQMAFTKAKIPKVTMVATAVLVALLAACSGSGATASPDVVTHSQGLPPSITPSRFASTTPIAAWARKHQIYVVVWGSGSCPHLPTTVYADRHNDLTVKTTEQSFGADACTADLGPTTSIVNLPTGIDLSKPLRVTIDGALTTLAPR
jgi:hypothetical protein